jgi:hypothetical protein
MVSPLHLVAMGEVTGTMRGQHEDGEQVTCFELVF